MQFMSGLMVGFVIVGGLFGQSRIEVTIPSAETEAAYIWRNLGDLAFFEKNNYQLSLPQGPLMDTLKKKARNNRLTDEDYASLVIFMEKQVYREADYQSGFKAIEKSLSLLNRMVGDLENTDHRWPFKMFETYEVVLTLYGPGGSYDPDRGSIIIYTTPDGQFKQYRDPINTLIHEIVHIGIEGLIHKYNVPHGLKERVVDTFVLLRFKSDLPDYRKQNMGDVGIDQFLSKKSDLLDLDQIIGTFMNDR